MICNLYMYITIVVKSHDWNRNIIKFIRVLQLFRFYFCKFKKLQVTGAEESLWATFIFGEMRDSQHLMKRSLNWKTTKN